MKEIQYLAKLPRWVSYLDTNLQVDQTNNLSPTQTTLPFLIIR